MQLLSRVIPRVDPQGSVPLSKLVFDHLLKGVSESLLQRVPMRTD